MNRFASRQRLDCVVCGRPTDNRGYCPEPVECNFESRLRLGMPQWQARKHRGADYAARRSGQREAITVYEPRETKP